MAANRISESVLAQLVESVADGIVVLDREGTHLLVNRAFRDMIGFDNDDLIGEGVPHPYWAPENAGAIESAFARTVQGSTGPHQLLFRHRDETRIPVLVTPAVVDTDGGERLFIATIRDRTKEVATLGRIDEANRLIETMIEAGAIGWWMWYLTDNRASVSDSFFTVLGYPPGAWKPSYEAWAKRVHPNDIGKADRGMKSLIEGTSETFESEHRIRTAEGEWRWALARGVVVERSADGTPTAVAGTVQDIDRVKRQEEKLHQFYKMEIVGQMAGGIAHDFNNLLMALSGNLELLEDDGAAESTRPVEEMRAILERASDLTGSLLRYARDNAADSEAESVSIPDELRELEPVARRLLGPRIELEWNVPEEECLVELVRSEFDRIVLNLVVNARDAIEETKGRIRVSGRCLELGGEDARRIGIRAGAIYEVGVEDNGTGMSPEVVERAFEPLFSTKPKGRGTGLGLSIVRKFVDGSGGTVRLRSTEGEGTTAAILLPAISAARGRSSESADLTPPSEGAEGRVLVVDDEPALLRLLGIRLAEEGYEVLQASSPRQGLAMLSEHDVDVMVTDIVMPHTLDGIALARRAREAHPDLAIVFMTGYADDDQRRHARTLGEIIDKPFPMADLLALLQKGDA